jgi:uncharacterized protein (TIGR02996 family)
MTATEDDLLAAIAADVDAVAPRLVYADWLLAREDPRGEMIVLEHRLAEAADNDVRRRADELEHQLGRALLLGNMQHEVIGRMWLGFVDRLKLTRRAVSLLREHPAWLDRTELRFVRALDLAVIDPRAWEVVAAWRHRGHVRTFEHGSLDKAVEHGNLAAIVTNLPRVTELVLRAPGHLDLDVLAPLRLQSLAYEARRLEDRMVTHLFAKPWPLHTLSLRTATASVPLPVLSPLFDGSVFPGVRDLELIGWSAVDVVERLVASGRIRTIETLRMPFASDPAQAFAPFADHLAHVRLELPILPSVPRHREFAVVLARLGKHAEAVALFERSHFSIGDVQDAFYWYAHAVRGLGDRERGRALVARVYDDRQERGDRYATVLLVVDELLAGDRDPELLLHRARALAATRRAEDALAVLAEVGTHPSATAIRALFDPAALDELVWLGPVYRALALLVRGELPALVPATLVTPSEIAHALGGSDSDDALELAELGLVAAVMAGDRACARARAEALNAISARRPYNFDVLVACEVAERALPEYARRFLRLAHGSLRRGHSLAHLIAGDAWLHGRA